MRIHYMFSRFPLGTCTLRVTMRGMAFDWSGVDQGNIKRQDLTLFPDSLVGLVGVLVLRQCIDENWEDSKGIRPLNVK